VQVDPNDPLNQANAAATGREYVYDRKAMVPPDKMEYTAQAGYKGAHFDHFYNWSTAIRNQGKVIEDPVFGYRAAAPALLCNDSYFANKIMHWDPQNLKVVTA
jgi:hypothetical protein